MTAVLGASCFCLGLYILGWSRGYDAAERKAYHRYMSQRVRRTGPPPNPYSYDRSSASAIRPGRPRSYASSEL